MSKNNNNVSNLVVMAVSLLLIYIGGSALYNSVSYMDTFYWSVGLGITIFGGMLLGVSINKLSVEYSSNSSVTSKKGKNNAKAKSKK